MSDESRHSVRRGRPLRTVQRPSTEARRRSSTRGAAANANRKRTPAYDPVDGVRRFKAILAAVYGKGEQ